MCINGYISNIQTSLRLAESGLELRVYKASYTVHVQHCVSTAFLKTFGRRCAGFGRGATESGIDIVSTFFFFFFLAPSCSLASSFLVCFSLYPPLRDSGNLCVPSKRIVAEASDFEEVSSGVTVQQCLKVSSWKRKLTSLTRNQGRVTLSTSNSANDVVHT